MRTKSLAAVVIACGIAVLAWFALRDEREPRASATPPVAQVERLQPAAQPEPLRDAKVALQAQEVPPTQPIVAPEPLGPAAEAVPVEPASITLYGFVREAAGSESLGEVGLSVTNRLGARESARASSDGAYSISGLAPGSYWISAGSASEGRAKMRVELDARESERRLDLQLALPPEVLVKAVDRAGEPLAALGVLAVATREPPGEWFTDVFGSFSNPFGVGHFWQSGFGGDRLPDGYLGKVILDVEPPVYVSLLHYHRVVATQRVERGQREVVFVLDRDSPLIQPVEVSFHFVDATTGERLESRGALFEGNASQMLTRVDGDYRIPKVAPGWYEVSARVEGYERARRRLLVQPGAANDLGAIPLEREVWISGIVVDASGAAVAPELSIEVFDDATGLPVRHFVGMAHRGKPDGTFRIGGLSRATYFVRFEASDSPWARTGKLIDTRAGPVENVRFALVPGVALVVRPSGDASREVRFKILDANGQLVSSSRLWSEAPYPIPLAPGAYTIEVRVGGGEPKRIPVTIGAEPVELALP